MTCSLSYQDPNSPLAGPPRTPLASPPPPSPSAPVTPSPGTCALCFPVQGSKSHEDTARCRAPPAAPSDVSTPGSPRPCREVLHAPNAGSGPVPGFTGFYRDSVTRAMPLLLTKAPCKTSEQRVTWGPELLSVSWPAFLTGFAESGASQPAPEVSGTALGCVSVRTRSPGAEADPAPASLCPPRCFTPPPGSHEAHRSPPTRLRFLYALRPPRPGRTHSGTQ